MERLRNRRTVVLHVQQIVAQGSFHAHGDRAGGRTEIDGVFDELVEQLYEQVGRAPNEAGIRGRLERDVRLWKSVAIGGDRRGEELAQIEIHALCLLDALPPAPRRRARSRWIAGAGCLPARASRSAADRRADLRIRDCPARNARWSAACAARATASHPGCAGIAC